jgi:hypothetical protein
MSIEEIFLVCDLYGVVHSLDARGFGLSLGVHCVSNDYSDGIRIEIRASPGGARCR